MQYNCKRWITRLAGRWRTELAPINGVNCRTRRTLDFRTHIAATGFPVALSVWGSVDLLTIMQVCSMRPAVSTVGFVVRHWIARKFTFLLTAFQIVITTLVGSITVALRYYHHVIVPST